MPTPTTNVRTPVMPHSSLPARGPVRRPLAGARAAGKGATVAGLCSSQPMTLAPPQPRPAAPPPSADHPALRERGGLLGRSARGKLAPTGAGAGEFLNGPGATKLAAL